MPTGTRHHSIANGSKYTLLISIDLYWIYWVTFLLPGSILKMIEAGNGAGAEKLLFCRRPSKPGFLSWDSSSRRIVSSFLPALGDTPPHSLELHTWYLCAATCCNTSLILRVGSKRVFNALLLTLGRRLSPACQSQFEGVSLGLWRRECSHETESDINAKHLSIERRTHTHTHPSKIAKHEKYGKLTSTHQRASVLAERPECQLAWSSHLGTWQT